MRTITGGLLVLGLTAASTQAATLDDDGTTGQEIVVTGRASPAPRAADDRYKPTPDASTLRSSAGPLETPQAVNIVPAQVIRDQRPRFLDDVLANVSGITQGNTLAATQDTVLKRGFGGNRDGSVMRNGMPLVQGRAFNAANQSVEVLKGPASLLYGIMDPGGVINTVAKKPLLDPHLAVALTGSAYAASRTGLEAMADLTGPIAGPLAGRLVLDHQDEDYWRNFGERRDTLIAPSLGWYGGDTQAVLWYEYRRFDTPFDRGTVLDPRTMTPLAVPRRERLDDRNNRMVGDSHLVQLALDHRLGGTWAAHLAASFNSERYDAGQLRVTAVNTTRGTLTRRNDATVGSLSTDAYVQAYLDGQVEALGMRHQIILGVEGEYRRYYRRDLIRQATATTFSYLRPVYGREPFPTTVSPSDSDQTDRLYNYSLFGQDAIHLGERWIVTAGGRLVGFDQRAGRGRPFTANTDLDRWEFVPQAGLVWRATDTLSLYGGYTRSLKPTSTIAPLASGVTLTSAFAPERGRSFEVGAKLDVPDRVTATLALYDIDKRNVLVSQFNPATALTDYRTAGRAISRGVELDVAGQVTRALSLIGSYAYTYARTVDDPAFSGNQLANVAPHTASLSAAYDVGAIAGEDRLRLGAGGRYVARRPGDDANSFWLASYVVADAFMTYDTQMAGRRMTFQFNLKNIFDRTYYTSAVNQYGVAIGDPRRAIGTVSFAF
ncbi:MULTISPECIES: TonB-dependent siderophore receptor [unclassified Sphingomonas]|uniref:TonB-dependent siderophore receptor n=1 Tax=unclassified Sphingomonas TaxID=196159 RepID=UPI002865598A|nr:MULTISPECIES: TonB-dependent siderophore receptor [unclassified Sphingomonas]MDR6113872.1 iron complex outermembrane receptor protein [Sphingomonas sp. SORGH_AS_0789]MDR6148768.1 iron complex outermembrane receptor protein [Sphingomonas sp. SORGH_AS_0742]